MAPGALGKPQKAGGIISPPFWRESARMGATLDGDGSLD